MSSDSIMAWKKGAKKSARKPRKAMRKPRRRLDTPDRASLQVTQASFEINGSTMYRMGNFALTNNNRATTVAQAYQQFRIKRVDIRFTPYYDTYGASGAFGVPKLYYMIDKPRAIPQNADVNTLKRMGATPHRFDDKTIRASFAPAILIDTSDNGSTNAPAISYAGKIMTSPWLPCNANVSNLTVYQPNSADHGGIVFVVDGYGLGQSVKVGTVEITISYEFKKPYWAALVNSAEPLVNVDVDTLGTEGPLAKASPPQEVSL